MIDLIDELTEVILICTDNDSKFNINLEDLVLKLKGKIIEDYNSPRFINTNIEASINILKDTSEDHYFEIRLHKVVHPNRKRFTIAHELGHLFLHLNYSLKGGNLENEYLENEYKNNKKFVFYRDMYSNSNLEEEQAHKFAGSLLMPYNLIMKYKDLDLEDLATIFGVSIEALKRRLEFIN